MKKLLLFFLLSTSFIFSEEEKVMQMHSAISDKKDVIFIEPKKRAEDFFQAFELVKKGKPPSKIAFFLVNGRIVSNVLEMSLMENGTLILLKIGTSLGHQYEIVPIENLITIAEM